MLGDSEMEIERKRLCQEETLNHLHRHVRPNDMVTVYDSPNRENIWTGPDNLVFCALIPSGQVERSLSTSSWDTRPEGGMPGTIEYRGDENRLTKYFRFGNDAGIESLVTRRDFYGVREDYFELNEEFRLFHNLYHDRIENRYIKIDDEGEETVVAVIENERNRVRVRLQELRQFLAIKEMHLSLQFDHRVYSELTLSELGLTEGESEQREGSCCWKLSFGDLDFPDVSHRTVSILHGKRVIEPVPKSKSGFPGFDDEPEKRFVDFIIGLDDNGEEAEHTCDPTLLANYFGANQDSPHFLTKVDFRRQVLDQYYSEPSKYEVTDGLLRCGYLWNLRMDNHHPDKVSVWLGDLGGLSYNQQFYWRSFNFVSNTGISTTYFRRQILGEPSDSGRLEDEFSNCYRALRRVSQQKLGWPLLLPLATDDEYHVRNIRVPATDEQKGFDELILGLVKTLVDSLNEKELKNLIPEERRKGINGGISLLELALATCGVDDSQAHVGFFRDLQKLRSTGVAHRKGTDYHKAASRLGADSRNLRVVFSSILTRAIETLCYLVDLVENESLTPCNSSP